MMLLVEFGVGSLFILSDFLLNGHPFVGISLLNPAKEDMVEQNADRDAVEDAIGIDSLDLEGDGIANN